MDSSVPSTTATGSADYRRVPFFSRNGLVACGGAVLGWDRSCRELCLAAGPAAAPAPDRVDTRPLGAAGHNRRRLRAGSALGARFYRPELEELDPALAGGGAATLHAIFFAPYPGRGVAARQAPAGGWICAPCRRRYFGVRRAHQGTPDCRLGPRRGTEATGWFGAVIIRRCDAAERLDGIGFSSKILALRPHNAILQVWLELGGVGIALGFGPLMLSMRRAFRMPAWNSRLAQGMMAGSFAAAISVAPASFGSWQEGLSAAFSSPQPSWSSPLGSRPQHLNPPSCPRPG